jgi:hypothetical protein
MSMKIRGLSRLTQYVIDNKQVIQISRKKRSASLSPLAAFRLRSTIDGSLQSFETC